MPSQRAPRTAAHPAQAPSGSQEYLPAPREELLSPGPGVRALARLRRRALDRALSDGADPAASALLAARAGQLSRHSTRRRIAAGLERLALSAERDPGRAQIAPPRAAVLANRGELLELSGLLRRDQPLYVRGLARLKLTLTDGAGPAYTDRHGEALARQLQLARAGLSG
jgi:hypothetical protein